MTWFHDGDGWRNESTEGPYDYLAAFMEAKGDLQIYRGLPQERKHDKYRITYNSELIGYEKSVAMAKAKAEQWYKENINATDRNRERKPKNR